MEGGGRRETFEKVPFLPPHKTLPPNLQQAYTSAMASYKHFGPLALPVISFALVIAFGATLLALPMSCQGEAIPFVDALFMATSAVCVTGLSVVDMSTNFSLVGQSIILVLIQLGGLGITTYTSLIFILWRKRVSIIDRLAVGQALLHDTSFDLKSFLLRLVGIVVFIEACGAFLLMLFGQSESGDTMTYFAAIFHSISAFCNAGFSLFSGNLMSFQDNMGVNIIFMVLIVLGGLGFSVIDEGISLTADIVRRRKHKGLSRYARLVLSTSFFLIVGGATTFWCIEISRGHAHISGVDFILPALFQSISARTAGFNTMDFSLISDAGLLILIFLMFIGGSPGSCAGGIKTTTFRVLCGFVSAQFKGRSQIVLHDRAVDKNARNKALTLFIFSTLAIVLGVTILTLSIDIDAINATMGPSSRFTFMDMLFETISAFATVGLSTGLTAHLDMAGKLCITCLMFIGRLGPMWLLTTLQSLQSEPQYRWPETDMPIG